VLVVGLERLLWRAAAAAQAPADCRPGVSVRWPPSRPVANAQLRRCQRADFERAKGEKNALCRAAAVELYSICRGYACIEATTSTCSRSRNSARPSLGRAPRGDGEYCSGPSPRRARARALRRPACGKKCGLSSGAPRRCAVMSSVATCRPARKLSTISDDYRRTFHSLRWGTRIDVAMHAGLVCSDSQR